MKKYFVVEFVGESTVELIPSSWLIDERTCFWPGDTDDKKNMIMKCVPPVETWQKVSIKIFARTSKLLFFFHMF